MFAISKPPLRTAPMSKRSQLNDCITISRNNIMLITILLLCSDYIFTIVNGAVRFGRWQFNPSYSTLLNHFGLISIVVWDWLYSLYNPFHRIDRFNCCFPVSSFFRSHFLPRTNFILSETTPLCQMKECVSFLKRSHRLTTTCDFNRECRLFRVYTPRLLSYEDNTSCKEVSSDSHEWGNPWY